MRFAISIGESFFFHSLSDALNLNSLVYIQNFTRFASSVSQDRPSTHTPSLPRLLLPSVDLKDEGQYRCGAENRVGRSRSQTKRIVVLCEWLLLL